MLVVYTATIFLSAALLFLVQPMIAKMVLPMLGGSPSVWITAMVFFQAILLAGYAYAHGLCRWVGPKRAAMVHCIVVVLPLMLLPIAVPAWTVPTGSSQAFWLLLLLLAAVGGPFFVLSSTGPILQRWFSQTDHVHAKDPYFLYAASNVGSLLALLGYPVLVEPLTRLGGQRLGWSAGYAVFALCIWGCAVALVRRGKSESTDGNSSTAQAEVAKADEAEPITNRQRLFWVLLAFVPSSLMLGVTNSITTDIASVPLLWIVPLSLYLLTFVLAFARRRVIPLESLVKLLPILAVAIVVVLLRHARTPAGPILGLHLAFFFFAALVCHTRLADRRPSAHHLTEFFLFVSIGGVLGGIFNALVAPMVFSTVAEYPIVIVLACLLKPSAHSDETEGETLLSVTKRGRVFDFSFPIALLIAMVLMEVLINPSQSGRSGGANMAILGVTIGVPALAVFLLSKVPLRFASAVAICLVMAHVTGELVGERLYVRRTFFGVYTVSKDPLPAGSPLGDSLITFSHGTTQHGQQSPARPEIPLGYYHRDGPIGHVFSTRTSGAHEQDRGDEKWGGVALIGLGAGALATYASENEPFDVYEIDQAVVDIALNTEWFTYLSASKGKMGYIIGDGRINIAAAERSYSLIVLDAFSSDAIPVHLLTKEAFAVYLDKLAPDGLIAVHITNRHLDLKPVVAAAARDLGLFGLDWFDVPTNPEQTQAETGRAISHWILLARSPDALQPAYKGGGWEPLSVQATDRAWTDDYSNIVGALRLD